MKNDATDVVAGRNRRRTVGRTVATAVAIGIGVTFVLRLLLPQELPDRLPKYLEAATGHDGPPDAELVAQGAYVEHLADCRACHTSRGGAPFAGGLAIKSPIGTIYSTNITPDTEFGIGRYSLVDFTRALRRGIRKDGSTLYPAMPYPSFARMTDGEIGALYAFFMHGVQPAHRENARETIAWPLSLRWPLSLWRTIFVRNGDASGAVVSIDPVAARGAYIVEGPGHCGACHTPRGFAMQEKALSASDGAQYLAGSVVDGWAAPSLRGDQSAGLGTWSEEDIAAFLRSGRTDRASVFGSMSEVVAWSTRFLTEEDLHAVAHYLKTLPVEARSGVQQTIAPNPAGRRLYDKNCSICHGADGSGIARMFPPLAGNPVVASSDPISLVHIVLDGSVLPPTNWAPSAVAMPTYRNLLSDQEISDVINYIRTTWHNTAPANTSVEQVASMRRLPSGDAGSLTWSQSGWIPPQPWAGH